MGKNDPRRRIRSQSLQGSGIRRRRLNACTNSANGNHFHSSRGWVWNVMASYTYSEIFDAFGLSLGQLEWRIIIANVLYEDRNMP